MHSIDESLKEMKMTPCNSHLLKEWRSVNQENVLSSFIVQVVEEQPGHFFGPCSTCKQLNFIDIQAAESFMIACLVSFTV